MITVIVEYTLPKPIASRERAREDAGRLYTDEWKAFVRNLYGCEPTLTYFDTPVVVDDVLHEIISTQPD